MKEPDGSRGRESAFRLCCVCHILPNGKYLNAGTVTTFPMKLELNGLGHQVGTCRFGEDPKTSVLDLLNCQANDLDNLYVVDGSFLVSSAAVNPTMTIIANALRVGEHLAGRLGGSRRRGSLARSRRTGSAPPTMPCSPNEQALICAC